MAHEHDLHGQQPEQHEQLPKVTVRGRIGQVYGGEEFQRKDGGKGFAFKFSVAEHTPQDDTVWYRVTAYDQKGESLQQRFDNGELHVGQEVSIVGRYREQQFQNRRTGQLETSKQLFPFEVKPVPQAPRQ